MIDAAAWPPHAADFRKNGKPLPMSKLHTSRLATMTLAQLVALSRENAARYDVRAAEREAAGDIEGAAKFRLWANRSREEADYQEGVRGPEPAEPPAFRVICDANKRRWRIEGPGWTMQPEGEVTAEQAEAICRTAAHALALNPALIMPEGRAALDPPRTASGP